MGWIGGFVGWWVGFSGGRWVGLCVCEVELSIILINNSIITIK